MARPRSRRNQPARTLRPMGSAPASASPVTQRNAREQHANADDREHSPAPRVLQTVCRGGNGSRVQRRDFALLTSSRGRLYSVDRPRSVKRPTVIFFETKTAYEIEGKLLEVCTCNV